MSGILLPVVYMGHGYAMSRQLALTKDQRGCEIFYAFMFWKMNAGWLVGHTFFLGKMVSVNIEQSSNLSIYLNLTQSGLKMRMASVRGSAIPLKPGLSFLPA